MTFASLIRARAPRSLKSLAGSMFSNGGYKANVSFSWEQKPIIRAEENPLRRFFEARTAGPGIWKWEHYFEIYHEHFKMFRGLEVNVLEIGIYSGGSLDMWRDYFGPKARIYGVDIEPACKAYEKQGVKVFIGDQQDRLFWQHFRRDVPQLDIVIDDGGHTPVQQMVTLEETLPHLRPGGVFLCEDVHGEFNRFALYVNGFSQRLNATREFGSFDDDMENGLSSTCNEVQQAVGSIHLYPYVTVIKRRAERMVKLRAPKHGTEWQPWA
jgi:hypothetical protein